MSINLANILARAAQVTEGDTLAAELAQDVRTLIDALLDLQDRIHVLTLERDQARGEA
jgi:hypothetical protein